MGKTSCDDAKKRKRKSAAVAAALSPGTTCVFDSQGGFACPGQAAYTAAWDAQRCQAAARDAWFDRWIYVQNEGDMAYVNSGLPPKGGPAPSGPPS